MIAEGGTKDLTYDQVLERFYPMAAALSGACRKEVTVFSGEVHRDNLARYEALVTAMIAEPRFAPEDFDRLAAIFSSYDPSSEFRRWQAVHGRPVPISPELFELHKNLIDIPSVTGSEHDVGIFLEKYLSERNYTVERIPIVEGSTRENIYAYIGKDRNPRYFSHDPLPQLYCNEGLDVRCVFEGFPGLMGFAGY